MPEGQTTAKIKPRKSGGVFRRGSRWAGVKGKYLRIRGYYSRRSSSSIYLLLARTNMTCSLAHRETKKGSEAAGLNMHGQGPDPDSIAGFDLYETFEIEFESSPSKSRLHGYYVKPMNFSKRANKSRVARPGQFRPQVARSTKGEKAPAKGTGEDPRGDTTCDIFCQNSEGNLVSLSEGHSLIAILLFIPKRFSRFPGLGWFISLRSLRGFIFFWVSPTINSGI